MRWGGCYSTSVRSVRSTDRSVRLRKASAAIGADAIRRRDVAIRSPAAAVASGETVFVSRTVAILLAVPEDALQL